MTCKVLLACIILCIEWSITHLQSVYIPDNEVPRQQLQPMLTLQPVREAFKGHNSARWTYELIPHL